MKLYTISKEYRDFLTQTSLIPTHFPFRYGAVFRSPDHRFIYLVPIQPSSSNDVKPGTKVPRSPAVMMMYEANQDLGKLSLSSMFPVPYSALLPYQLSKEEQPLIMKQVEYITRNEKRIQNGIKRIYLQKKKGYQHAYLEQTLDFNRLEQACHGWELRMIGRHINRFPDQKYFLYNNASGTSGQYTLMHKDTPVLDLVLNHQSIRVEKMNRIIHPDHLPFDGLINGLPDQDALSRWLQNRGIPSWRDGLDDYLFMLDRQSIHELIPIAYALSLSDCYWLNPCKTPLSWDEINFYHNSFASEEYEDLVTEQKPAQTLELSLITPNNTTDGALAKTWITDGTGGRYLLKKARPGRELEIYCERLASLICDALHIPFVPYTISPSVLPLCSCPAFTSDQREYITAYSVLYPELAPSQPRPSSLELYEYYISRCQDHGLSTAATDFAQMVLVDSILMNTDRHLGNFGIVRHPDTLEWISMAPVFDSGNTSALTDPQRRNDTPAGRFFHSDRPFDEILERVLGSLEEEPNWEAIIQAVQTWEEEMKLPVLEHIVDEQIYAEYVRAVYAQIERAKQIFRRLQDPDHASDANRSAPRT